VVLFIGDTLSALGGSDRASAPATFRFPFRYGYAAVGEVLAAGDGVDPEWLGRNVFAFQPHASAFAVPVADAVAVPAGLPAERAVLLAAMETAVNLILDGRPLYGERVVVLGQGTVGLLATALLAAFPLERLVAVEGHPLRAEAARRLAPRDLDAALTQITDIESVGRQALTEIREAVTGYREGSLATELDRARSALSAGAGRVVGWVRDVLGLDQSA